MSDGVIVVVGTISGQMRPFQCPEVAMFIVEPQRVPLEGIHHVKWEMIVPRRQLSSMDDNNNNCAGPDDKTRVNICIGYRRYGKL